MDGLDRRRLPVRGRSRCDCGSECGFLARFDPVRYDTRMTAAAARTSSLEPRQCGTDSRKKRFAQRKVCEMRQACCTRNIVRSGTDIRRGYAQTSNGKKLKGEQAYPKIPHLPWQLHGDSGSCYLARASSAHTTRRCLRREPRVHYGYCLIETAPKLHLLVYCCPIFFFLLILFRYSVIDFHHVVQRHSSLCSR